MRSSDSHPAGPHGRLETIDVCIWRMFVFQSVVVTVLEYVVMFVVNRPLLKIVFFSPWSVEMFV